MTSSSDYLFVYGTLRPTFTNPFAHFLRQHSLFVGEGSFSGQLFDLGNYPGAIYLPQTGKQVIGAIYNIGQHKTELLSRLDDYEGIGDRHKQPHEYVREVIPVDLNRTYLDCWVYLYNLPFHDKRIIESGDYLGKWIM